MSPDNTLLLAATIESVLITPATLSLPISATFAAFAHISILWRFTSPLNLTSFSSMKLRILELLTATSQHWHPITFEKLVLHAESEVEGEGAAGGGDS